MIYHYYLRMKQIFNERIYLKKLWTTKYKVPWQPFAYCVESWTEKLLQNWVISSKNDNQAWATVSVTNIKTRTQTLRMEENTVIVNFSVNTSPTKSIGEVINWLIYYSYRNLIHKDIHILLTIKLDLHNYCILLTWHSIEDIEVVNLFLKYVW